MTLVLSNSAAVTGVPLGSVSALVVPFKVSVTGSVVVASAGTTSEMRTVKYPIGCILRKPSAMSMVSVPTVVFVDRNTGIPPALVVILTKQLIAFYLLPVKVRT